MNKVTLLTVIVSLSMLLISCGQKLTENLATELIRKAEGYPRLVSIHLLFLEENSPMGQEISRLVTEGYIGDPEPEKDGHLTFYRFKITEKGKNIVKTCTWVSTWSFKGYNYCELFTHKEDVAKIKKILTESKSGTATITYEVGFTPTPYFDKISKLVIDKVGQGPKSFEVTRNLKKYDQGWVVIR